MKIFGINISRERSNEIAVRDIAIPDNNMLEVIETKPINETTRVHNPILAFQHQGGAATKPSQRRSAFQPSEYDLYEIGRIEDVDSYVRQAFKKKVGLFLKEGFDYVGRNKKIVNYIKARFSQIALSTSIPHNEFIRRLASQFIRKSNAFVVKVRDEKASGGKVRTDPSGKVLKPIAGYFIAPPETMQIKSTGAGDAYQWRQLLPNGAELLFDPKDVAHFTFDRKEGFLFGTPTIIPVIDDIRALRTIEQNIELLVYKHLFPLFHFKVGTEARPAGITEDGEREIDVMKRELQFMPTEGGLVTSERFEIDSIGSESKALRAESYIDHFKHRVFSGLGMSSVDFGESDTSNRSTADNMSRALIDDIKDYQESFEAQFNAFIVDELLLEANFDDDVLSVDNRVELSFREIDIDKQIKVENHNMDIFLKDGITWDELRVELGRDPIKIPDDPETQDPANYHEWFNVAWKLFREPEKMIAAKSAPYSPFGSALAANPSSGLTTEHIETNQNAEQEKEIALAKAKAAAKPKPLKRKDSLLLTEYGAMSEAVVSEFSKLSVKFDYVRQKLFTLSSTMEDKLRTSMNAAFISAMSGSAYKAPEKTAVAREEIRNRAHLIIKRLRTDIEDQLSKKIDIETSNVIISKIRVIFDAFQFRVNSITETEITRAKNLGLIYRALEDGALTAKLMVKLDTCETCKNHATVLSHLENYTLNTVPPHHPSCKCDLIVTGVIDK